MYFKIGERLNTSFARQICTNVSRNSIKSHYHTSEYQKRRIRSTFLYCVGGGILCLGLTYASVPLYRIFCQTTSYGGTTTVDDTGKLKTLKPNRNRTITVKFNADTSAMMAWDFHPQQSEIHLVAGETALAFYTATNPLDVPVIGISTYNVVPFEAGQYFNKIQCFCFEEQMLNPHEQVDMPVFFYIDPEFTEDPLLEHVHEIVLSYTFFEASTGFKIPVPSYIKSRLK